MHIATFKIRLIVQGPFIIQSSTPMDYGIDAALARDKNDKPYIPGTSIIGQLRKAWLELDDLGVEDFKPNIEDWLGKESFLPKPKRLHIGDLVSKNTPAKRKTNYRIRIDSKRNSVEKGAYLVTECPFAPGEEIVFQGIARFISKNEDEVERLTRHLEIGLKWLSQVGAYRTVGFGKLIDVNIESIPTESIQSLENLNTNLNTYDIIIKPESPFCITEDRIAKRLFKSSQAISGGVIIGALATMWTSLLSRQNATIDENLDAERPDLGRHFNKLHVTHAFPSSEKVRPIQKPLSLVRANDTFYDVALCEGAGLIDGYAPAFAVDWKGKDYSEADKMFGWANVKRELRVRTAIDSKKRSSADEQLFAYEMVVPTDDIAWYARLDLSDIDKQDRPKVVEQLQSLIAYGLTGLSKTKSYAQIELLPPNSIRHPYAPSSLDKRDGVWILTLQTPALLCNPDLLTESSQRDAYAEVFDEISDKSLELVRFFATQSLAGGGYLWKRFQDRNPYQPYLLTDTGSVFVLCPKTDQEEMAKNSIEKWTKMGLPLPNWAVEKYQRDGKKGNHWSNCPYIPQNGYGEIAVNLSIHWDKHPKFELIHKEGEK